MREPRDRLPEREAPDLLLGFHIRREPYPSPPSSAGVLSPLQNKENFPPAHSVSRRQRKNRTLPPWHPRTPLRDITAIVNAVERRRNHLQAGAKLQRGQVPESASPLAAAHEHSDSEDGSPPVQDVVPPIIMLWASSLSDDLALIFSPCKDFSAATLEKKNTVAADRGFSASVDNFEKILMESFNSIAKKASNNSRMRTLASLR